MPKLASLTGVTPHQLSEYLNQQKGCNFKAFINRFRIEEAQRLLLTDDKRSVISVAYAVGFNSKSSFNDQFARYTGSSPAKYRRRNLVS